MALVLPKYGNALTLLKAQRKDGDPPPKKTARLDPPAPGSASTSTSASLLSGAPVKLTLVNGPGKPHSASRTVSTEPPSGYKRTLFGRLANTIRTILPTERSGDECMSITEAHHACRTLVRAMDMGENVYRALSQQLEQYITKLSSKMTKSQENQAEWVDLLAGEWKSFENRLKTLQCMLSDIDRVYVPSHSDLTSIYDLGLAAFRDMIMIQSITDKIQEGIVGWLNQERLNSRPDYGQRESILTLRNCLVALRLYGQYLEEPYLVATTSYWTDEGAVQRNADDFSAAAYIENCVKNIKTEEDRARVVLLPGGWEPVGKVTEQALLADVAPMLASKALATLLLAQNKEALKSMCELYRHAGVLTDFRVAFKTILLDNVREIVMAGADPTVGKKSRTSKARSRGKTEDIHPDEKIVPGLIALRTFAKEVIKDCFNETKRGDFAGALDDAFSIGVGARDYVPSAMMAQALDREMRRGQRNESDEAWKAKLFGILELSRYTRDKDVFREIYTRALAKRLLTHSTTDDDMEKTLIVKLKSDYDPEFSAGDIMFKDLQQSSGDMEDYRRRIEYSADELDQSLNVVVLTHAKWPSFKEHNMLAADDVSSTVSRKRGQAVQTTTTVAELPPKMAASLYRFEKYYKSKHERRRMAWFHSLGTVVLTSRFPGGNKEISVSMYQALVLLLFNEQDQYTAAEIQARTKLSKEDLEVTLQSLALGKKRVLVRADSKTAKEIALEDEFKWNSEFTDTKRNLRIQSIQQQTTMEETQEAEKDIVEGRSHVIDAAIVRIMKAKKTLTYEQLKTETIEALKKHFLPTVADIKKRIDDLQEKEYIERDLSDKNLFRYVA
ncbi:cullin family [Ceratobasidium sp. AG-Ba]|nr:cullin family [Ceratobasidium sp. AG-Ba]